MFFTHSANEREGGKKNAKLKVKVCFFFFPAPFVSLSFITFSFLSTSNHFFDAVPVKDRLVTGN